MTDRIKASLLAAYAVLVLACGIVVQDPEPAELPRWLRIASATGILSFFTVIAFAVFYHLAMRWLRRERDDA